MTDRTITLHQHIFNPLPMPERLFNGYSRALDEAARRMAGVTRTPHNMIATPTPRKGDKVEVTTVGFVDSVDGDTITLVDKRTPFKGEAKTIAAGPIKSGDGFTVRVVERAPAEPKVGDVIDGATLKATPWKRGTLVSIATFAEAKYALGRDGQWTNINSGVRCSFDGFSDDGKYRVEHAPGK